MSRDIKAGRAFVELFADKAQLERDLRAAEVRVRSFGKQLQSLGMAMTAVGALAAAAIVPAITVFAGFQQTMSTVQAVTGATGEAFESLTAKARELGATTSFSAQQAAEGMKFLGMAGFDTQQILAGIPHVLNLAKAGAVELGVAADIASDVSSAFGLTAEEIERVADVMAKAAASANVSIEGLGESFKFAAPAGNAAGQAIEEVTAALATLGNSGLKGSIAGRNLQIMFKQLADATVQDKLRAMNVEVADAQGNFRDLSAIMKDLQQPLRALTEVERVRFLNDAFGEAAKAAQILTASADGFVGLRQKLDGAAGSAAEMSRIMRDNLTGDFQALVSAAQEAAIAFVSKLEPSLRSITQGFTDSIRGITDWINQNQGLVIAVTASAAAIGGMGVALTGIGLTVVGVSTAIGGLKTVVGIASVAVTSLTGSMAVATKTSDSFMAATARLSVTTNTYAASATAASAATSRLSLSMGASSAGAAASTQSLSGFSGMLSRVGASVMSVVGRFAGMRTIMTSIGRLGPLLLNPVGLKIAAITAAVAALGYGFAKLQQHFRVFDPLIKVAQDLGGKISSEVMPVFRLLSDTIHNQLLPAAREIGSAFSAAFSELMSAAQPVFDAVGEFFGTTGMELLDTFSVGIETLGSLIKTALGSALDFAKAGLETLVGTLLLALDAAAAVGLIQSREERERGQRLDKQLADLKARREAAANPPAAHSSTKSDKAPETPPGLNDGATESPAADTKAADELQSFADGVKRAVQTTEEAYEEYMAKLEEAFAAQKITAEDFARAAAQQQQQLTEAEDKKLQAAKDAQRERDDDRKDKLQGKIDSRVDLARANGDVFGEIKGLAQGASEADRAGFGELAAELGQRLAETLAERAVSLEERYRDSLETADFQTSSAQEAMFGIGRQTVDEQSLQEAKQMRKLLEDAKGFLQRVAEAVEE